jgi:Heterokaryon incompatibility protein (HET)
MVPADTVPTNQPPWMFLPTRLLLVEDFVGYLRLLLREEIEERSVEFQGNDRRYAILGPGLVDLKYYTDNDNYFQRRSEIFSDGVLLQAASCARSLGIQFLWVPEICIIQENEDDERREASFESDVYDHATLIWLTEEDVWLIEKESDRLLAAERRAYETHSMGVDI